jgi:hypothetical protein
MRRHCHERRSLRQCAVAGRSVRPPACPAGAAPDLISPSAACDRLRGTPMPSTIEPTTAAMAERASRFSDSGTVASMDVAPDEGRPLPMLDRPASDSLTVRLPRNGTEPVPAVPPTLTFVMLLLQDASPLAAAAGSPVAGPTACWPSGEDGSNTGARGDSKEAGCRWKPPTSMLCRRALSLLTLLAGRHHSVRSAMLRLGCSHIQGPLKPRQLIQSGCLGLQMLARCCTAHDAVDRHCEWTMPSPQPGCRD